MQIGLFYSALGLVKNCKFSTEFHMQMRNRIFSGRIASRTRLELVRYYIKFELYSTDSSILRKCILSLYVFFLSNTEKQSSKIIWSKFIQFIFACIHIWMVFANDIRVMSTFLDFGFVSHHIAYIKRKYTTNTTYNPMFVIISLLWTDTHLPKYSSLLLFLYLYIKYVMNEKD